MLAKIHPPLTSIGVETHLLLVKQAHQANQAELIEIELKPQIGFESHKPIYVLQSQIGLSIDVFLKDQSVSLVSLFFFDFKVD